MCADLTERPCNPVLRGSAATKLTPLLELLAGVTVPWTLELAPHLLNFLLVLDLRLVDLKLLVVLEHRQTGNNKPWTPGPAGPAGQAGPNKPGRVNFQNALS